jgi:hypothetical protein
MSRPNGQIVVTAAGLTVAVAGAPIWATGVGVVLVAGGAAVALAAAGYGVYRYLAENGPPPNTGGALPGPGNCQELPRPPEA